MQTRSSLLPMLAIAFNALVWGVLWWPVHLLRDLGVHALWVTLLTYSIAIALLLSWRPGVLQAFKKYKLLWLMMLTSGATNACFNWAVSIGDVMRVVLLLYLMPVWSLLLSWLVFKKRPRPMALVCVALALCGVMLVLQPEGSGWRDFSLPVPRSLPDVLALISGMSFACTSTLLNRMGEAPAMSKVLAMFGGGVAFSATIISVSFFLGAGIVSPLPALHWKWPVVLTLLSLVLISCNMMMQYGAARMQPHTLSLLMTLEVPFAAVSSSLLGAAQLGGRILLGGTLVMAAVLLSALDTDRRSQNFRRYTTKS